MKRSALDQDNLVASPVLMFLIVAYNVLYSLMVSAIVHIVHIQYAEVPHPWTLRLQVCNGHLCRDGIGGNEAGEV